MRASRIGVLAPLAHRDFRRLAEGSLVSLLGDGVFRVTIAVQVLAIRNDPRALSLVAACWAISQFAALPFGGWAADRFPRRTVMLVADVVRMAALAVLAALSLSGDLQIWHLCALGMAVGASNGFFNPTAVAFVPDLLPDEALERANAFMGVARPLMVWILGPLLGALVIAATGPGGALALDAVTFGVSALLLWRIAPRPAADESSDRGLRRTLADVAEGIRFVRARRWAWAWIAAAGVSTMLHSGAFEVLLPTLLLNEFGLSESGVAAALAGVFAAGGAGSVLVSAVLGQRGIPRRFMTVLFVLEGGALAMVVGYGLVTRTWMPAVIGGVIFTLFALTDIIATTLIQRLVPRRMLGRVASLDWMTSIGLAPVGYAIAGPIGHVYGPRAAIIGLGVVGAVVVLGLGALPGVREPERRGPLAALGADEVAVVPPPSGDLPVQPPVTAPRTAGDDPPARPAAS